MAIKQIRYAPTKNEFGAIFAQRPRPKPKPKPKKALSYRDKLTFLLEGNEHSGNYGHVGRPGQQGGSGPSSGVPKEPGTTPIPKGKIRGYHYTEDMDAVEREGLDVTKAKGSTYGEPNAIWFSTEKPGDFKHYVEVFLDPEELGVGRPSMVVKRPDGWKNAETPEEKQEALDEYNRGNHNFTTFPKQIKPDRFVTTHRPWHHHYRYLTKDPKQVAAIVAGEYDWGLDDPEYAPAIRQIKAEAKKSLSDLFSLYGTDKSGNYGHKGRPGEVGGSAPDGEENAEDDPYALAPDVPRGGEGQGMLFEYAPESGSEGALRLEAEKVTATMDALLPEAIQNADYEGVEAKDWDEIDLHEQNVIKAKWADDEKSNEYVEEAGQEAANEYIQDHLTPDAIFERAVKGDALRVLLEDHGIDPQSLTFKSQPSIEDGLPVLSLDWDVLRDKYGVALAPDDPRLAPIEGEFSRQARWASRDIQSELAATDGYTEAITEAEDKVMRLEWMQMGDDQRYAIAKAYGMIPSNPVEHEAPGVWKFDGDMHDEDYAQTRAVALELAKERTADLLASRGLLPKQSDLGPNEAGRQLADTIGKEFWKAWKSSSTSPLGAAMQMVVAEEMGVLPSAHLTDAEKSNARDAMVRQFTSGEEQEHYNDKLGGFKTLETLAIGRAKAYVRAQWETTQYVMQQAGVESVDLFRGVILPKTDIRAAVDPSFNPEVRAVMGVPLPNLHLLQNSVASTTTKPEVANTWNGIGSNTLSDPTNDRAVLRFKAPVSSVFSIPVFGVNIHEESEVVLMGTKGIQWDAYAVHAPTFDSAPMVPPPTTGTVTIVEPEVTGLRVTWQLADQPKPKPVIVNLATNVDGHWLVDWRRHKDRPLPKKRVVPTPHKRTSDALAQVIVRGMKKGMVPTMRKLSAYREKLLFLLEGNAESGHHGHAGRVGQVGGSLPGEGRRLDAQAEKAIATMDGMLGAAVKNAGYGGVYPSRWDQVHPYDQQQVEKFFKEWAIYDSRVQRAGEKAGEEYLAAHPDEASLGNADGFEAAVKAGQDQAIADQWANMSDAEKLGKARVKPTPVKHDAPGTWKFDGNATDEDYVRSQAVARELATQRTADLLESRGLLPKHGDDFGTARQLAGRMSAAFWEEWKGSSTSELGIAMQMAVAEEMGVHQTHFSDAVKEKGLEELMHQFVSVEEIRALNPLKDRSPGREEKLKSYKSLPPAERDAASAALLAWEAEGDTAAKQLGLERAKAYIRAQWETTQYVMHKAGVTEVELYRGLIMPKTEVEAAAHGAGAGMPLPNLALQQNAAASTSTNPEVANTWKGTGHNKLGVYPIAVLANERVVVRFRAPVRSLFSIPVFGLNEQGESEVVLMGTKGLQWDAWRTTAPEFATQDLIEPKSGMTVAPPVKSLADDDAPPPVVVDLFTNVDGNWLYDVRHPKEPEKPKDEDEAPAPKALSYREKLQRFLLVGTEESGNYGHAGRPGQVGGSAPSNGQQIADTTGKPHDDGQRIYLPTPSAKILRGVNSHVNAKIQIEKALQDHEASTGERPTPEQLKATEEALRALPFLHSTSVAGALGALDNGLMSHAEMDKHRLKFETAANALEDELKDLMGPGRTKDELVPNPYERRTPYSPKEVQEKLGLSEADATTVVEKVAELRALRTVLMGTTNEADEYLGLDGFVFMTHGRQLSAYGTVAVVVDNAVFNQPGSFATKDDIAHLPGAFNQDGGYPAPVIAQYKDQIVTGDDYYRVAAARAGEPYRIPQRAAVQLDEIKTPRVPKEAVKGFVVTGSLAEAQQLAAKLKERGLTGKVLYIDSDTAVDTALQQEQLRAMQTTGQWDPAIVTRAQNKMGQPNPPRTMILRRDS